MSEQSWQIVATPADRWQFAVFLLHPDLKFKGKRRNTLYRFRCALGLIHPTEAILGERKGKVKLGSEKKIFNLFTVTTENTEFFNECLNEVSLGGAQLSGLEPVLSQFDTRAPTAKLVEKAKPYDEASEDWSPSTAPILDAPDRYVDINASLLRRSNGSFEEYVKLYVKEVEPANEGPPRSGIEAPKLAAEN